MNNPIFEIITTDSHIKIYANGVVDGLKGEGRIVNHICTAIRPDLLELFSKSVGFSLPVTDAALQIEKCFDLKMPE